MRFASSPPVENRPCESAHSPARRRVSRVCSIIPCPERRLNPDRDELATPPCRFQHQKKEASGRPGSLHISRRRPKRQARANPRALSQTLSLSGLRFHVLSTDRHEKAILHTGVCLSGEPVPAVHQRIVLKLVSFRRTSARQGTAGSRRSSVGVLTFRYLCQPLFAQALPVPALPTRD